LRTSFEKKLHSVTGRRKSSCELEEDPSAKKPGRLSRSRGAVKLVKSAEAAQTRAEEEQEAVSRDTQSLGQQLHLPATVIDDIHIKSELGRYDAGLLALSRDPSWETDLPAGTADRFVIEGYARSA